MSNIDLFSAYNSIDVDDDIDELLRLHDSHHRGLHRPCPQQQRHRGEHHRRHLDGGGTTSTRDLFSLVMERDNIRRHRQQRRRDQRQHQQQSLRRQQSCSSTSTNDVEWGGGDDGVSPSPPADAPPPPLPTVVDRHLHHHHHHHRPLVFDDVIQMIGPPDQLDHCPSHAQRWSGSSTATTFDFGGNDGIPPTSISGADDQHRHRRASHYYCPMMPMPLSSLSPMPSAAGGYNNHGTMAGGGRLPSPPASYYWHHHEPRGVGEVGLGGNPLPPLPPFAASPVGEGAYSSSLSSSPLGVSIASTGATAAASAMRWASSPFSFREGGRETNHPLPPPHRQHIMMPPPTSMMPRPLPREYSSLAAAAARAEAAFASLLSDNDDGNNASPPVGYDDSEGNDESDEEDDNSSQLVGLLPSNDASSDEGGDPSNFGEGGGEGGGSPSSSSFRKESGNESGRKKRSCESPLFTLRDFENESGRKRKKDATTFSTKGAAIEPTSTSNTTTTTTASSKEEAEKDVSTCCICLEIPTDEELSSIKVCIHSFCFSCIERWADQENTCPLCKMRFHTIEKVNRVPLPPKRCKGCGDGEDVAEGGGGGGGCSGVEGCGGASGGGACTGERTSKRVRNRDQRSDVHGFINPLEGIFASMEANGTWPMHIAQLLFSGLGASSRPPLGFASSVESVSSTFAASAAARRQRHPTQAATSSPSAERVSMPSSFRYGPASSLSSSGPSHQPGRVGTGAPFTVGGGRDILQPPAWRPVAHQTTRRTAHTPSAPSLSDRQFSIGADDSASSPWSARASVSVTLGPQGFGGRSSSSTRFASYRTTSASSNVATSRAGSNAVAGGAWGAGSLLFPSQEEEEETLLSALSPSSYIRRLHSELERGGARQRGHSSTTRQEYRSSGDAYAHRSMPLPTLGGGAPDHAVNAFGGMPPALFSFNGETGARRSQRNRGRSATAWNAVNYDAAGLTRETALEIVESDDDDNDVVEVIDVEAFI